LVSWNAILGLAFLVFADHDAGITGIHVTWNLQVIRGWFVLEHSPGKIKRRTVARAQEPALPIAR
jgi:hypothetical protein